MKIEYFLIIEYCKDDNFTDSSAIIGMIIISGTAKWFFKIVVKNKEQRKQNKMIVANNKQRRNI